MTDRTVDEALTEEQSREVLRVLFAEIAGYSSRFHPYDAVLVRDRAACQLQTKREVGEILARLDVLLRFLETNRIADGADFDPVLVQQIREYMLRKVEQMMLKAERRFADA